jgi:hypothetical protein
MKLLEFKEGKTVIYKDGMITKIKSAEFSKSGNSIKIVEEWTDNNGYHTCKRNGRITTDITIVKNII